MNVETKQEPSVSGGRLAPYVRVLGYAARDPLSWLFILLVTLAWTVASVLVPFPMKVLVDQALAGQPPSDPLGQVLTGLPGGEDPYVLIVYAALSSVFIFAANAVLEVTATISWVRAGRRMVYALSVDLFARIQRRSTAFHSRASIGDSISRITWDSWGAHTVVDTLLFAPGHALIMVLAMSVVMLQMDVYLTALSLVVAPVMVASTYAFGGPTRRVSRRQRDIEGGLHAHVQRTLSGLPLVQTFGQEHREYDRLMSISGSAVRAYQKGTLIVGAKDFASGFIKASGTTLVLIAGSLAVLDGHITVGSFLVFLSYLTVLQAQFDTLAGVYIGLQEAGGSIDRVMEVLDTEPEVIDRPDARALGAVRGHVRAEDVVVGYEPQTPVLRRISFEAKPGETIALVGPTGAGKSTLVSLIPRLLDPWSGRVTIDGHDIRDVQLRSLRDQVAVVLQEPFLFPMSIADNIAYGRPAASREDIVEAAKAANAHAFIERLSDGYDTEVGERGSTLSGGERQRLSIARALLKDAPILILDEPTSALDAETEHSLLEALGRLMQGRTTLIIAHRLSTIRRADRILVLRGGEIVESGDHAALMAAGGFYAHLYQLQFKDPDDRQAAPYAPVPA